MMVSEKVTEEDSLIRAMSLLQTFRKQNKNMVYAVLMFCYISFIFCLVLLLLPAEQDVVVLMRDDCSCPQGDRALLASLQAVFTQLHSVVVAVTVA